MSPSSSICKESSLRRQLLLCCLLVTFSGLLGETMAQSKVKFFSDFHFLIWIDTFLAHTSQVVVLTGANFQDELSRGFWFIDFYAPCNLKLIPLLD